MSTAQWPDMRQYTPEEARNHEAYSALARYQAWWPDLRWELTDTRRVNPEHRKVRIFAYHRCAPNGVLVAYDTEQNKLAWYDANGRDAECVWDDENLDVVVAALVRGFRKAAYAEYLASDAWKAKRKACLKRARFRCQRCGRTGLLHAHHVTYERLGDEWPSDLLALCEWCHEEEHARIRARRTA